MNPKLFDYILRIRNVVKPNQPMEIFTSSGITINGRFIKCYLSEKEGQKIASLIEVDTGVIENSIYKNEDIIILKVSFLNEYKNNFCDYNFNC
jgi:hypothetical protein